MKKNMGTADKTIRIVIALLILALYFTNMITGTAAIILLIFAAAFILTSLIGSCPAYSLIGFSTRKKIA